VNVAFAGFDAAGNATNIFDTKEWSLTKAAVQKLQHEGRSVMLSVGGGDGAILDCASPPSFSATLATSLLALVKVCLNFTSTMFPRFIAWLKVPRPQLRLEAIS
jgi:chitinase